MKNNTFFSVSFSITPHMVPIEIYNTLNQICNDSKAKFMLAIHVFRIGLRFKHLDTN